MPKITPTISATQSLTSALRLKLGWINSMTPPKALAPTKTGRSPKRPVRASGKARAAKATRCTSLSLPSGAGGRRLQGPQHRDGQGERHDYGEGDVEVLAHPAGGIGQVK